MVELKKGIDERKVILSFWDNLKKVREVSFVAKSLLGLKGCGKGDVKSTFEDESTILFYETGILVNEMGGEFQFSNVYRFRLDRMERLISLEHLRFGPHHPVFLFHLRPNGRNSLESVSGFCCNADTYFGSLQFDSKKIDLHWRIIGPKKNEEMEYQYRY